MAHRWVLGTILGAISLMVAVGCGGGGGDTSTTVTKAEFTKQADEICASGKEERKDAFVNYSKSIQETSSSPTRSLERKLAGEMVENYLVPSLKRQLQQLEDLGAPAADEAQVSKMLATLTVAIEELEKKGVQALVNAGELVNFQKEAQAYGLACNF